MNVKTSDFRCRMREIWRAVGRNEPVHVFHRGKEVALLVAARPCDIRDDPAFGMWADRKDMEDVHAYLHKLRHGRRGTIWGNDPCAPTPDTEGSSGAKRCRARKD
jgi:hypothetical protein